MSKEIIKKKIHTNDYVSVEIVISQEDSTIDDSWYSLVLTIYQRLDTSITNTIKFNNITKEDLNKFATAFVESRDDLTKIIKDINRGNV